MWTIHTVCDDYSRMTGNPGQKHVSICGGMIAGSSSDNTHIDFKMIDCTFHNCYDFIEGVPSVRVFLDSLKRTESMFS